MFGVLVVEHTSSASDSSLSYLAGYSGQICGRSDWEDFVPAVFDYLQPDGYFKREEAEIVKISEQLKRLPHPMRWRGSTSAGERPLFSKGKKDGESEEEYIRRRQFENAEVHRWKLRVRAEREEFEARERRKGEKIHALKTLRRQKSDALQTWLFRHFIMKNARGEEKDLIDIFQTGGNTFYLPSQKEKGQTVIDTDGLNEENSETPSSGKCASGVDAKRLTPPAGSGECCEPKLLQYAFAHGLKPVSMAMFWWGESPRKEVRHHLQCYPACNGKCKPILRWMLQGMDVEPNPLEQETAHELEIIYEDVDVCVVNKPAGMLAVPGKSRRESVQSVMRRRYPHATGPLVVHRLDMATSGLMVIAKSMEAYKDLQAQFAGHEVKKRYVAILSKELPMEKGSIALPLRPDLDDRPRQVVDFQYGKPAHTYFERISECRVALYPYTGRTHQLRVHCAHKDGLNNPIKGDELYGERADRLYLHAEHLVFRHPRTGREMKFTIPPPF
ncbi:MAG: RluA family pseudouridine synthase [Prevotella sp.]